ncbi:glycolipid transfer protein (GLTP) family protein [Wolffia australiana]
MGEEAEERPLKRIAEAFHELDLAINSIKGQEESRGLDATRFSRACSLVSFLFGCLGIAFKFAELDYVAKVEDLKSASESIATLESMLQLDIDQDTVRKAGSHTRNLLRVKRGLDMVKVLFEQILVSEGNSLRDPASVAYAQVFAPHHGWVIRKAVAAGMYALPSKSQLLKKLNEEEATARVHMKRYVSTSASVVHYVNELFLTRNLGIDW